MSSSWHNLTQLNSLCPGAQCAGAGGGADAGAGPCPHEWPGAAGGLQVWHPRPSPAVRHGHCEHNHPQGDWSPDDLPGIGVRSSIFSRLCWVFKLHPTLSCFGKMRNIFREKKKKNYILVPGSSNYSLDNGAGSPDSLPWRQTICHGWTSAPPSDKSGPVQVNKKKLCWINIIFTEENLEQKTCWA